MEESWVNLYSALKHKQFDEASKCLQSGVNINFKDNEGFTMLHICSYNGLKDCVDWLLKNANGVDVTLRDAHNRTCLDVAKDDETRGLIEGYIKQHGITIKALPDPLKEKDKEVSKESSKENLKEKEHHKIHFPHPFRIGSPVHDKDKEKEKDKEKSTLQPSPTQPASTFNIGSSNGSLGNLSQSNLGQTNLGAAPTDAAIIGATAGAAAATTAAATTAAATGSQGSVSFNLQQQQQSQHPPVKVVPTRSSSFSFLSKMGNEDPLKHEIEELKAKLKKKDEQIEKLTAQLHLEVAQLKAKDQIIQNQESLLKERDAEFKRFQNAIQGIIQETEKIAKNAQMFSQKCEKSENKIKGKILKVEEAEKIEP